MIKKILIILLVLLVVSGNSVYAADTEDSSAISAENIDNSMSETVETLIQLTLLSFLTIMLIMLTGYVRILIVLGLTRNAMGLQNVPPNQVIIILALFITFFITWPSLEIVYEEAYLPYSNGEATMEEAFEIGMEPIREFMMKQTNVKDLNLFLSLDEKSNNDNTIEPEGGDTEDIMEVITDEILTTDEEIPNRVLIPAFMISELKNAFQIGFLIYIPFVVIDMLVSSILMSMGMMMLPPVMISAPIKILIFVMAGGWNMIIELLIRSFN